MCSPAAAIAGSQAGGLAYQTVGAYYAANAQKSALKGQAALDDINARLYENQAEDALQAGQYEEQAAMLQTAQLKSQQRVSLAANGVDLGSDSAVNILTSTDVVGEWDKKTIAGNALRAAFGYRQQAVNSKNSAIMARGQAKGISPVMAAGSTLLTGASAIATSYAAAGKATGKTTDTEGGKFGFGRTGSGKNAIDWQGPRMGVR